MLVQVFQVLSTSKVMGGTRGWIKETMGVTMEEQSLCPALCGYGAFQCWNLEIEEKSVVTTPNSRVDHIPVGKLERWQETFVIFALIDMCTGSSEICQEHPHGCPRAGDEMKTRMTESTVSRCCCFVLFFVKIIVKHRE